MISAIGHFWKRPFRCLRGDFLSASRAELQLYVIVF